MELNKRDCCTIMMEKVENGFLFKAGDQQYFAPDVWIGSDESQIKETAMEALGSIVDTMIARAVELEASR